MRMKTINIQFWLNSVSLFFKPSRVLFFICIMYIYNAMLIDIAFITVYNIIKWFCLILWYEAMADHKRKLFQTLDWCYEMNLEQFKCTVQPWCVICMRVRLKGALVYSSRGTSMSNIETMSVCAAPLQVEHTLKFNWQPRGRGAPGDCLYRLLDGRHCRQL